MEVEDPMVQKHFEILQTRHGNGMELSLLSETPSMERLTNLLLVEGLTDIQQKEHDVMQIEATKGVKTVCKTIPLEKVFLPLSKVSIPPRISLTVGVAGIGKSTLVKLLVYKWVKGEIYKDIAFVLPFTFRELNAYEKLSVEKLIRSAFPHISELTSIFSGAAKVILILDGLDEFKSPLDFSNTVVCTDPKKDIQVDNLITNIIRGNLLPEASVWITSRPTSASQIPGGLVDRMTEIRGFGEAEIQDFYYQMFDDKNLADQVLSHIKGNKSFHIMCTVPSFCWIAGLSIGHLLKNSYNSQEGVTVPKTLCELYSYFFKLALNGDWTDREKETLKIDQTINSSKKLAGNLGKLAFYGLIKRKYVFYEQDMKTYGIDLTSLQGNLCNNILLKDDSQTFTVYYFTHLTLQEYMAATYYYTAAKRAIFDLFTESGMSWPKLGFHNHFKNAIQRSLQSEDGQLDIFVRFLAGLLSPQVNKLLSGLLLTKEEHNGYREHVINLLQACLNTNYNISSRTVNVMHCLHELQHTEIARTVEEAMRTESLAGKLTPVNCSALAYLLQVSETCMEETNLSNCLNDSVLKSLLSQLLYCHNLSLRNNGIGPRGAKALSDALKMNQALVSLNLQNNQIGEEGAKCVADFLQVNRRLTTLHLQKNSIGPEGAKRMAEALKNNCSLKEFILSSNCVGDKGAAALAKALKVNKSLTTLDLRSNSISNTGVTALTEALKCNQGLIDLNLRENSIGIDGAKEIANALRENCTLKNLDLTANLLHDEGAKAIAIAIEENQTLTSLHLQWNFIRSKAAKALAQALQFNESLASLDLQENSIGDEGISALSAALKMNKALTALHLQGTSVGVIGAKSLAEALTVNQSLTTLDLRGNSIGVEGAKAMANALKVNCSLRTLNLQENSLGMDGAICIATALTGNHGLTHINLQGNRIGESGAKVISDAIKSNSPNCIVEI
nr:PREDICTED: protein NLRC3 [Latimeria chalumnae]|eukprot:XP_014347242.1 PREDICTED: protein NLRC3 [Latimeria chalumnae]